MPCLIGRISLTSAPIDPHHFSKALSALSAQLGPSATECLTTHRCALATVEPASRSVTHAPFQYDRLHAVIDGRLHNRHALIKSLGLVDDPVPCDAAVLAQAYARWGRGCLSHLHGEFSVAVYDEQSRALFLARDHVGTRPLYWSVQGDEVFFSSLLHGVIAFPDVNWSINEGRVAEYLCFPYRAAPASFWHDICAVEPGECVQISQGKVDRHRWWRPEAHTQSAGVTDQADALEGLRHHTELAVADRMVSSDRIGSHLSGGIDSTVVTTLAVDILRKQGLELVGAYSWSPAVGEVYAEMANDERPMIVAHCRALGIAPSFGTADGHQFEALINRPMELEGTADLADELPVVRRAQADGVTAMLSGWGGDELFSNHAAGYFAGLLRTGRLRSAARLLRAHGSGRHFKKSAQYLWQVGVVPNLPDWAYRWCNPFLQLQPSDGFASHALQALVDPAAQPPPVRLLPDPDAYLHGLIHQGHIGERMATWAAWSAPAGFEYRYPLTDRRLWEFMLALPGTLRFGRGRPRWLARKAFADRLPKGLSKADMANEKRRAHARMQWWRMLADDVRRGRFDEPCDWLDMKRLKKVLVDPMPQDETKHIITFIHIFMAMRVWAMYGRQKIRGV